MLQNIFVILNSCFISKLTCILLICLVLIYVCVYNFKRIKLYKCASKLPGPISLPIIGNAHLFMFCSPSDIQPLFMRIIRKYGGLAKFWLGPELNVLVSNPKYVETVLLSSATLRKGPSYKYMWPYLGFGLLSGWGKLWRQQRKLVSPCFKTTFLEKQLEVFTAESEKLVENLTKHTDGKLFNILHEIAECTHNIVCETLLGVKIEENDKKHCSFIHHIEKLYGLIFLRMTKWWYQNDFIYGNSKYFNTHLQISKQLKEFGTFLRSKKIINGELIKNPVIALDTIIDNNTSEQEFNGSAITLHTASQESTATISSFVLLALGIHKDMQTKVYKELESIFEGSRRPLDIKDLNNMSYLDLVIKETLRMFPIGATITRSLDCDFPLTDDITLPVGCTVTIPIYCIHHHPDHWHEPEKFIPERFLPEQSKDRHLFSYLPFSYGPMSCIGQKYAILLIKTIVSKILTRYTIDTDYTDIKDVKLMTDISIRPVNGYMLRLSPRN